MFDWIRNFRAPRVERKLLAWHTPGRPVWPMRDHAAFAREGYAKNAVAYRCVRMIAEAAASAPLKVGPAEHPQSGPSSELYVVRPDGANAFAIEDADGEWEVVQVRACALVAPNEYELHGFLRGQLGSGHAMRAPHPVGARIVKLDRRLARVDIQAHEWGEALAFVAPPASMAVSNPRAATATISLPHAAARPRAPAHLRARRVAGGDVAITWVRCARSGDTWGAGEPPVGATAESYQLEILDGATVRRTVTVVSPSYEYSSVDQIADFGAPPASLRVRVAQIGPDGAPGLNKELTIAL